MTQFNDYFLSRFAMGTLEHCLSWIYTNYNHSTSVLTDGITALPVCKKIGMFEPETFTTFVISLVQKK